MIDDLQKAIEEETERNNKISDDDFFAKYVFSIKKQN